jgi:hypothetical protein
MKSRASRVILGVGLGVVLGIAAMGTPASAAQSVRHAPVTTASQAVPASASTAAVGSEVRAEYRTADGITHGALFLAAAGVSAKQLYQNLQKAHVRGLIDPSAIVPLDSSCSYGTAECLNGQAPPDVWARNGYTNPQIYYHDMSSSAWPEGTVISQWNNSPNIHVAWTPNGCPGYSGTHCVNVSDGYYGTSGVWYQAQALTWYNVDANHYFIDGSVSIQFNDSYSSNHRAVACQETGHSFGMGHNLDTGSCMYAYNPYSGYPDSDDYSLIKYVLYP